jgi:hypothetical protein
MEQQQGKYVRDLKGWELPRLEDLEIKLVDELTGTVVNETIEYWLRGLADGNDGRFPELSVEFPYLERNESTDALTVAYCVDNEDGTRTEPNRATLERVLMRVVENDPAREHMKQRVKVVASELRVLAAKLEGVVGAAASLGRRGRD